MDGFPLWLFLKLSSSIREILSNNHNTGLLKRGTKPVNYCKHISPGNSKDPPNLTLTESKAKMLYIFLLSPIFIFIYLVCLGKYFEEEARLMEY